MFILYDGVFTIFNVFRLIRSYVHMYVCTYIHTVPPIADYWQSITLILDRVHVHPDGIIGVCVLLVLHLLFV